MKKEDKDLLLKGLLSRIPHNLQNVIRAIDWLNMKGFDYSGLIDKNLAKKKDNK